MPSRRFSHGWRDSSSKVSRKTPHVVRGGRGHQLDLQLLESWFGHASPLVPTSNYIHLFLSRASYAWLCIRTLYIIKPAKGWNLQNHVFFIVKLCSFSLSTIHEPELGVGRLKQWDQTWRKWQQVTFFEASLTYIEQVELHYDTMMPSILEKVDIAKPMTGSLNVPCAWGSLNKNIWDWQYVALESFYFALCALYLFLTCPTHLHNSTKKWICRIQKPLNKD